MFYFCSTETWLEKWNNDFNDPSSLNPGGICDSGLSLNRYLQAHPGDTGEMSFKIDSIYINCRDLIFKDVLRTHMYMSVDIYSLP